MLSEILIHHQPAAADQPARWHQSSLIILPRLPQFAEITLHSVSHPANSPRIIIIIIGGQLKASTINTQLRTRRRFYHHQTTYILIHNNNAAAVSSTTEEEVVIGRRRKGKSLTS